VDVLLIYGTPDKTYGADQAKSSYLVDCATLEYRLTGTGLYGPNGAIPPPLVRYVDSRASEPGSAMREVLDMTCGKVEMSESKVADPYQWGKTHLRKR
jgi:hypothetical protein